MIKHFYNENNVYHIETKEKCSVMRRKIMYLIPWVRIKKLKHDKKTLLPPQKLILTLQLSIFRTYCSVADYVISNHRWKLISFWVSTIKEIFLLVSSSISDYSDIEPTRHIAIGSSLFSIIKSESKILYL